MPHMPDNVKKVTEIGEIPINQCCIGSCTNSSYYDMMKVAAILKGKTVDPNVSLTISPGSKQVFNMLAQNGALSDIISAGARILECACGPCIGMGQSPESAGVSLRTFNRNFEGRPARRTRRSTSSPRRSRRRPLWQAIWSIRARSARCRRSRCLSILSSTTT